MVTWTSYGQDGDRDGVYARRYNILGQATSGEIQVNTSTANRQDNSDVAADAAGNFTVVWESYTQDGNDRGVFGQRFNAAGAKLGGEFRVNDYTVDKQQDPKVVMSPAGDIVVTWASFGQDGSGYGVYARRYSPTGAALGGELLVNQMTINWQVTPDVGMDANGNFYVTWSGFGKDQVNTGLPSNDLDYGIYARMFNANGSDLVSPTTGQALGEFRVNATVEGNQTAPAIGVAGTGEFVVAWIGADSDRTGIYSRLINPTGNPIIAPFAAVFPETIGLYNPASSSFYLRDTNTTGVANTTFIYGPGGSGWDTVTGDWDGDGIDTIGLYNPATGTFYLRNSNDTGVANTAFLYGPANSGWTPLAGDWDGNGIDTIGLYNPVTSTFYLRNSNNTGVADVTFTYGPGNSGWTPLVGDWNADLADTPALYNPTTSKFYLRNSNSTGVANLTFAYGPAGGGWTPMAGDWVGDATTTIGLYDPAASKFYLRDSNTTGVATSTFAYGPAGSGWTPILGDWTGSQTLMAAAGPATTAADMSALTQADLQPIVGEAIARWTATGLDDATVAKLRQVQFVVGDLSGSYLGKAGADRIYLDVDAAGHGWFVDSTPALDEEYAPLAGSGLQAIDARAVDRIDLLSVVEHELGHIAGLDDLDALADSLMSETLEAGVRHSPF